MLTCSYCSVMQRKAINLSSWIITQKVSTHLLYSDSTLYTRSFIFHINSITTPRLFLTETRMTFDHNNDNMIFNNKIVSDRNKNDILSQQWQYDIQQQLHSMMTMYNHRKNGILTIMAMALQQQQCISMMTIMAFWWWQLTFQWWQQWFFDDDNNSISTITTMVTTKITENILWQWEWQKCWLLIMFLILTWQEWHLTMTFNKSQQWHSHFVNFCDDKQTWQSYYSKVV